MNAIASEILDPEKRRRLGLAGVLACAAASFLYFLLPLGRLEHCFPIDDSYITLTAARNIAQHNLFAINPDAPGAGITSPLHVLLVGFLGKAIGVETADRALGLVALLFAIAGTFIWSELLGARWIAATVASLALVAFGALSFNALNGLETDLFAALIIWTFVFMEKSRDHPRWTYGLGALVGLAMLTRPEGYFLAAAVFSTRAVELLWRREFRRLPELAIAGGLAAAIVAPYLLYNLVKQGHFFPPTVSAKKYFFSQFCAPLKVSAKIVGQSVWHLLGALSGLAVVLLAFARSWQRRGYALLFLLIFYTAYLFEFAGALQHYWGRYQMPLLPILFAGMAVGGQTLAGWLFRRPKEIAIGRAVLIAVALLIALGGAVGVVKRGVLEYLVYRHALSSADEYGYLMGVVKIVRENTEPGDLIAAHDIGILSYFAERPLLDMVGLTDPTAAKIHREYSTCKGFRRRPQQLYEYLQQRRPKLVVFFPDWDAHFLGLLRQDRGRHMQLLRRHTKTPAERLFGNQRLGEYDFYLCDWDHDLREAEAQK
jgi:hypothetical protein